MILTSFGLAAERLAGMRPLIEDYATAEDPKAEFANNVLSKRTIIWGNGSFGKIGETPTFSVETEELALCCAIADGAKAVAGDLETGFGSESSDAFLPFFRAANTFDQRPKTIDASVVEACFAGTLFPAFSITVEPLTETADWWDHVRHDADGSGSDHMVRWIGLLAYFQRQTAFVDTAFVSIGIEEEGWSLDESKWPPGTIMAPSVFPRLLIGLTYGGSLSGLLGWCVYT